MGHVTTDEKIKCGGINVIGINGTVNAEKPDDILIVFCGGTAVDRIQTASDYRFFWSGMKHNHKHKFFYNHEKDEFISYSYKPSNDNNVFLVTVKINGKVKNMAAANAIFKACFAKLHDQYYECAKMIQDRKNRS